MINEILVSIEETGVKVEAHAVDGKLPIRENFFIRSVILWNQLLPKFRHGKDGTVQGGKRSMSFAFPHWSELLFYYRRRRSTFASSLCRSFAVRGKFSTSSTGCTWKSPDRNLPMGHWYGGGHWTRCPISHALQGYND